MNAVKVPLWWVTITCEHRSGKGEKRFAHVPVRAASWTDAAVSKPSREAEDRLLAGLVPSDYVVEIRVYMPGADGAEGLAVAVERKDGGE